MNSLNVSHNPYFNRWFSAILTDFKASDLKINCHNPYFNRWFSAINLKVQENYSEYNVTILILIDGFLQFVYATKALGVINVTILILIDGFLQYTEYNSFNSANLSHNPYFNRWFSAIYG